MMVTKVDDKKFVGKDIIHVAVFNRGDKRTTYNMIYRDGKSGTSYIKRFNVSSITRDRAYDLTQGKKGSQILYFSANPNGEAEVVAIFLRNLTNIRKLKFDIDFSDISIKSRSAKGNQVTKYPIKKIELKEKGVSTLKPRKIWFDDAVNRLNVDERGELLGEFKPQDKLLVITQSGKIKTITPELTTHFDEDMIVLEKWIPEKPISAIYYEGEKGRYFVKRFVIENENKEEIFISEHPHTRLEIVSTDYIPRAEVIFAKVKGVQKEDLEINIEEFITVKGIKALGNQLTADKVKHINLLEPIPYEPPQQAEEEQPENDNGQLGFELD